MNRTSVDYTDCEGQSCRHELARGVTVADLIGSDGPYPTIRFATPAPGLRSPVSNGQLATASLATA